VLPGKQAAGVHVEPEVFQVFDYLSDDEQVVTLYHTWHVLHQYGAGRNSFHHIDQAAPQISAFIRNGFSVPAKRANLAAPRSRERLARRAGSDEINLDSTQRLDNPVHLSGKGEVGANGATPEVGLVSGDTELVKVNT
jgi:hypothetical protein